MKSATVLATIGALAVATPALAQELTRADLEAALRQGPDGTVVFSSGPNGESHGLVGVIRPNWAAASWAFRSHVQLVH